MKNKDKVIKKAVKKYYGSLAKSQVGSCCAPSTCQPGCCSPQTAEARGLAGRLYDEEQLKNLTEGVTGASLGCGNPTALAELRDGETVLDLGSGGGLDCFLAAEKVGARGKVIGLDMTPEMIGLARENAARMAAGNVEFRLGEMEHMPVEDSSVDVIISNCVINLSPDKDAVFRECLRVLKPGGRLFISDIVTNGELPSEVRGSLEEWAACIAGALPREEYQAKLRAAGFKEVTIEGKAMRSLSFLSSWDGEIYSATVKASKAR